MRDRTARGNRLGLLLTGLPLLVLGALGVARSLGALPRAWVPAGGPVLDAPTRAAFARQGPWPWWVVAAVAVALALLGLRWLLAQTRRHRLDGMRLDGGPAGITELRTRGVTDALAAEVAAHPSVLDASAALVGTQARPVVRLRVLVTEDARMDAVREQLGEVAVPHVRQALETERLPAVARVTLGGVPHPRRTLA
ncbi:hypothetical protein FHS43_005176 [Streptosporangium becharense]|uniref:Alkaline shock response membrane anchor protein AmaP n=1 Tax=Streptosporangium becharense TaxID=1816182 RepID=A0A7W9MHT7_9ACTN|nr:alkaline shock response membrane anchor protein AmaP [Streptosporangium becharense]MBB2913867.1 hypothetical protein [Streptosporangium becharense]MBB5821472.1 hypothetical protein [Streptosporangium becharense]